MLKFIRDLFRDKNDINEKAIIGFASFLVMCAIAIVDMASKEVLAVHQFIFDGFLWLTLGCFGIASVDKWINRTKRKEDTDTAP